MDSKALNAAIAEICDDTTRFEVFGGKSIAYIGWFWREVDFDRATWCLGVLPDGTRGFMQNNKWGYDEVEPNADERAKIREALIAAVRNPCHDTLYAVNDAIQAVSP